MYRIALDNGHEALGYTAGKMRRYRIKILIGARLERENRRLQLRCALGRPRDAVPFGGHPVEADCTGEPVPRRGREPSVAAAEAEADGEDRACARAKPLDGCADVRLDSLGSGLLDVLRVLEVV